MSNHTPGPWSYEREHRDAFSLYDGHYTEPVEFTTITMGDGNEFQGPDRAEVYGPAQEANARLIAAAPETAAERDRLKEINADLLEALKGLEQALRKDARDKTISRDTVEYHLDGQAMYHAINSARAAIAKAEGR